MWGLSEENKTYQILLIHNDSHDLPVLQEAVEACGLPALLHIVYSAADAIEFLRPVGLSSGTSPPDLILLEFSTGRDLLTLIRDDERLKLTPVVAMGDCESDCDVTASYELSANCFITKPVDAAELRSRVEAILRFWLSVAALPPRTCSTA